MKLCHKQSKTDKTSHNDRNWGGRVGFPREHMSNTYRKKHICVQQFYFWAGNSGKCFQATWYGCKDIYSCAGSVKAADTVLQDVEEKTHRGERCYQVGGLPGIWLWGSTEHPISSGMSWIWFVPCLQWHLDHYPDLRKRRILGNPYL